MKIMKSSRVAVLGLILSGSFMGNSLADAGQVSQRGLTKLGKTDRKIASMLDGGVTGGDVGDRPALTHCTLSVTEELPILRIKLKAGAQAEVIPGTWKLKVPEDKIASVERLNPTYFNGDYSAYGGFQETGYVVLHTSVPHPKLEFDVYNDCGRDIPDGLCLLKLKKDGKVTEGVSSNFDSADKSLSKEYHVPEATLLAKAWVEQNKSTGVTQVFAALHVQNDVLKADRTVVEMNDDASNVRLPIGKGPARVLLTVILGGTPSLYKVSPSSNSGPKSDSMLVECH